MIYIYLYILYIYIYMFVSIYILIVKAILQVNNYFKKRYITIKLKRC